MAIKSLIFDFDGVFTLDDYTSVLDALEESSGLDREEITTRLGDHEQRWVTSTDSSQFLEDIKNEFKFPGKLGELVSLLNQRGDSGLIHLLGDFEKRGLSVSILSNQLAYRVSHVRKFLDDNFGIEKFTRVYFSPEVGLQKPYVGFTRDDRSTRNVSKVDIFPRVVRDMLYLGFKPQECLFIDDSRKNIEMAARYGINGIRFENVPQMGNSLKEYGIDLGKR